jgi:hypothetical protein
MSNFPVKYTDFNPPGKLLCAVDLDHKFVPPCGLL